MAAVTPTAGGLVFTGDLNGDVLGIDGETGNVVWRDSTDAPIGGGVITYQSGGRQRIAVAAGMNSRVWPVKTTTAASSFTDFRRMPAVSSLRQLVREAI